jgi:hypothetical protein
MAGLYGPSVQLGPYNPAMQSHLMHGTYHDEAVQLIRWHLTVGNLSLSPQVDSGIISSHCLGCTSDAKTVMLWPGIADI